MGYQGHQMPSGGPVRWVPRSGSSQVNLKQSDVRFVDGPASLGRLEPNKQVNQPALPCPRYVTPKYIASACPLPWAGLVHSKFLAGPLLGPSFPLGAVQGKMPVRSIFGTVRLKESARCRKKGTYKNDYQESH